MTDQEILTKAIQKAIDGGWTEATGDEYEVFIRKYDIDHREEVVGALFIRSISSHSMNSYLHTPEQIIFNHDFAKALWGKEKRISAHNGAFNTGRGAPLNLISLWQYHLQQMVIADDPIKYLGENI